MHEATALSRTYEYINMYVDARGCCHVVVSDCGDCANVILSVDEIDDIVRELLIMKHIMVKDAGINAKKL